VTPTPTSHVPSDEAVESPTRERSEKKKKKKHATPKKKKYKRRSRKGETISSDSSGASLHTDERTQIELKGGESLKCGKKGEGSFEVLVRKHPKQGPKERTKERHNK
jgi:hypothetical protein